MKNTPWIPPDLRSVLIKRIIPNLQAMTIKDAQILVDDWIKNIGNGYFSPVTNVAVLAEEVGELAHVVVRRYGQQRPKQGDAVSKKDVASELADVLWVILALANQTGVDLSEALRLSHEKKSRRDAIRFR